MWKRINNCFTITLLIQNDREVRLALLLKMGDTYNREAFQVFIRQSHQMTPYFSNMLYSFLLFYLSSLFNP